MKIKSEVLAACGVKGSDHDAWWIVLDCGHWYKWSGTVLAPAGKPPRVGSELACPACNAPKVAQP